MIDRTEHYGRTDTYELIGPYATCAELAHALDAANREARKQIEVELLNAALDRFSPFRTVAR